MWLNILRRQKDESGQETVTSNTRSCFSEWTLQGHNQDAGICRVIPSRISFAMFPCHVLRESRFRHHSFGPQVVTFRSRLMRRFITLLYSGCRVEYLPGHFHRLPRLSRPATIVQHCLPLILNNEPRNYALLSTRLGRNYNGVRPKVGS